MPQEKDFKKLVRGRMARTGESFTAARARLRTAKGADPVADTNPDARVLAAALEAAGIVSPMDGRPFSADLLFGLAGGIGFCYFVFEYPGWTSLYVNGAHNAPYFERKELTQAALDRLGIPVRVRQSPSPSAAAKHLRDALTATPIVPVTVDPTLLGAALPDPLPGIAQWTVGVSESGGGARVFGLASERVLTWEELAQARAATRPAKNRLFQIGAPDSPVDVHAALLAAIRMTAGSLLKPAMRNFGVPGMRMWSALLTNPRDRRGWPALFGADPERALRWVTFWLAGLGTGGAACRPQYAAFLDETAELIGKRELAAIGAGYRRLAGHWADLARPAGVGLDRFAELAAAIELIADSEEELAGALDRL